MKQDSREIIIGGAAVVTLTFILAFLYGGREMTVKAAGNDYLLRAAFNRVDGLLPGAEVRLGGIQIGRVDKQALDANYRAQVVFRINGDILLPTDTSAAIHTDGLFGSKYVVLEPGGDEKMFKDGDLIEFTQDALIVSELLDLIISQGRTRLKAGDGAGVGK